MLRVMLDPGAYMPERAHAEDAGLDLRTPVAAKVPAHGFAVIDTGVHIEIPEGYYGKLESKSGLMVYHGVTCVGGVVDCGYTGSIVVMLRNDRGRDYWFEAGEKIVQLIVCPCLTPPLIQVDALEKTERGNNGFGSTGV